MHTLVLTATLALGIASQYAPGVMERVVRYRQARGQLPQNVERYAGFVAVPDCDDIGTLLWVRPESDEWELFMVADCASRTDERWQDGLSGYEWMQRGGVLVEVDHQTATRWDCVGRAVRVETALVKRWRRGGEIE